MPVDHSDMKLGKAPPLRKQSLFRFESYLSKTTSPLTAPDEADYSAKVLSASGYPMLLNNSIGDCVPAGGLHVQQTWLANNGVSFSPTDAMAQAAYTAVAGYNPNDPSTDQGTNEESFLEYWRTTGIGHSDLDQAHKIYAYMALNIQDTNMLLEHTKLSVFLFGAAFLGVALPISAQTQDVWDIDSTSGNDPSPGSWGGHCVPIVKYDSSGFWVVTWGALKKVTYGFYAKYVDEAYAVLSMDWANAESRQTPSGFSFDALDGDLSAIAA